MSAKTRSDAARAVPWAHLRGTVAHASDPDLHPHPDSLTLAHHTLMYLRDFAPLPVAQHLPDITLLADALEEAFWQANKLVEQGHTVTLTGWTVVEPARRPNPYKPQHMGAEERAERAERAEQCAAREAEPAAPTVPASSARGLRQEIASAHAALLGLLLAAQRIAGLAEWRVRALGEELTAVVDGAARVQAVLEDRP
ncbi:hypothetical protein [uncultured Lamprocystis sp.]|jgi:hypothetical protein|uniref:hypothetical protein n=1 Tax=uncultured Lamprocystis sp. TaxID=543132 RepID=UPI0025EA69C6|nr:hypothetical protein [uncultured Lamprocystis sp.]